MRPPVLQPARVRTYRRPRWEWATIAIALIVATVASVNAWHASDRAHAARRDAEIAKRELQSVVLQVNRANAIQRHDIDAVGARAKRAHKRIDLVIDAVDAVAKTCPGRFAAPMALDQARETK